MSDKRKNVWLSKELKGFTDFQSKNNEEGKDSHHSIRGDKWDQMGLKELLAGKHRRLYDSISRYQDIKIIEAKDIRMYLNEQLQFSSLDERIYHEAFVHIPMALTQKRKRVLILGGGDGLALREVLKYKDVKHVDLIDLDGHVLQAAREIPEMAEMNDRAFFDRRVNAHAMDAVKFVKENKEHYDVIIIDFPDPTVPELAKLYSAELYNILYTTLDDEGIIVCQSNSVDETPIVFWSIGRTMEAARFHTTAYHTVIPSFGDWGFQLASKKPLTSRMKRINVPHRTLPDDVGTMFKFPNKILSYKRRAVINSENRLILHEVFNREVGEYL